MNTTTKGLRVALAQQSIIDLDCEQNLKKISELIASKQQEADLIVFPEAMLSGFSTEAMKQSITWEGAELKTLQSLAKQYNVGIACSVFVEDRGKHYNRFILCDEEGNIQWQDKKHLFRLGNEPLYMQASQERKLLRFKGWRILPIVCYDLRFPVWCRCQENDYDLIICIANWPRGRRDVWSTLLRARAMENLAYVIGVNRIGTDLEGLSYSGDSALINPRGEVIAYAPEDQENCITSTLHLEEVNKLRAKFPVWQDADPFSLH